MERVYHYTTMSTLFNLMERVKSSSAEKNQKVFVFRATNIFYMNDPLEYVYGQKILVDILENIESKKPIDSDIRLSSIISQKEEEDKKELLDVLLHDIDDQYRAPYVISFSRNIDSLPMWLNYGGGGEGVCLAFAEYRSKVVAKSFAPKDLDAAMVEIYDTLGTHDVNYGDEFIEKEKNLIVRNVDFLYDYYLKEIKKISKPEDLPKLQEAILRAIFFVDAPYIKAKEYKGEKEARLVRTTTKSEEVQFRCNANGHIVPYMEVEIPITQLDYVMIGPLANKSLSIRAIEMMKKKYGLTFEIQTSNIKYRKY